MSVPLLQFLDGGDDVGEQVDGLVVVNQSQLVGTDKRCYGVTYIGRGGLVVGKWLASNLIIVRNEPIVLLVEISLEIVPGVAGQLLDLFSFAAGEALGVLWEFLSEQIHKERSTAPRDYTEYCGYDCKERCIESEQYQNNENCGTNVVEPELGDIVAQCSFGTLGGFIASNPVEQVLVAEPHTVTGTHKGIGVHPCLLGQDGELNNGAVNDDVEASDERHIVFVAFAETWQLGELTYNKEYDGTCHNKERKHHNPARVYEVDKG